MYIERVDSFDCVEYLGNFIDEILYWNKYVQYKCISHIQFFAIFDLIKYKINTRSARHKYNTFIYSKIKYGMEIYGSSSSIDIGKIQITQN